MRLARRPGSPRTTFPAECDRRRLPAHCTSQYPCTAPSPFATFATAHRFRPADPNPIPPRSPRARAAALLAARLRSGARLRPGHLGLCAGDPGPGRRRGGTGAAGWRPRARGSPRSRPGSLLGAAPLAIARVIGASASSPVTALRPRWLWMAGLRDLVRAAAGLFGLQVPAGGRRAGARVAAPRGVSRARRRGLGPAVARRRVRDAPACPSGLGAALAAGVRDQPAHRRRRGPLPLRPDGARARAGRDGRGALGRARSRTRRPAAALAVSVPVAARPSRS